MKSLLVLSLGIIFSTSCRASIMADSATHPMTKRDSVREHYLTNGAWRHSIYSNEYGQFIDSAITLSHDDAYLWQQRGMPYMKQMKYEVGMLT